MVGRRALGAPRRHVQVKSGQVLFYLTQCMK